MYTDRGLKENPEGRNRGKGKERVTSPEGFWLVLLISRYIFVCFKITECGFLRTGCLEN
jgi:hypothetical protein